MTPLRIFTWGYDGWGSSTEQLKKLVNSVEKARGWESPLFVDIRLHRNVRASGFRGDNFAQVIGNNRYRWMKSLGNKRVNERSGPPQIADPTSIEELLGLALSRAAKKQRTIIFCSCALPKNGERVCHRMTIAKMLRKAALRRNVKLSIQEWPGGSPRSIRVAVKNSVAEKALAGARNLKLGNRLPSAQMLALPWGSILHITSPSYSFRAIADPPSFRRGQWLLPLPFGIAEKHVSWKKLMTQTVAERRLSGLDLLT